jgi:hypothetical protein
MLKAHKRGRKASPVALPVGPAPVLPMPIAVAASGSVPAFGSGMLRAQRSSARIVVPIIAVMALVALVLAFAR